MAWVWRLLSATTLESWQEGKLQNSTLALVNITKKPKHVFLFSHYLLSRIKKFSTSILQGVCSWCFNHNWHYEVTLYSYDGTQCAEILLVPSVSVWQCVATRRSIIISERTPSLQGHHLFIFLFFSVINKNSQFVFILFLHYTSCCWLHWLLCDMILVYCLFIETLHYSKVSRLVS